MNDKNILTKIDKCKLSRRSLLKWTGIATVPVVAGGVWSTKYLSENGVDTGGGQTSLPANGEPRWQKEMPTKPC